MTGLGYTAPAAVAVLTVCAVELAVLRTGLFRRLAYWLSMLIVLGFQIPVDGWLTKLSSPIVSYDDRQITGLRFPFDIPIEDPHLTMFRYRDVPGMIGRVGTVFGTILGVAMLAILQNGLVLVGPMNVPETTFGK